MERYNITAAVIEMANSQPDALAIAIPEKTPEVDLEANLTPEQRTKLKGMINNGIDQGTINKYLLRVNATNAAEKEKNKTK